jgi:serine/threonine protein kinase
MGAVYLARRERDGARVALKVMLAKIAANEERKKAFAREAGIVEQLRHPNVVEFYEQGCAGTAFYFTMAFCEGSSIDKLMERRGGKLAFAEALPIMMQSLDGLVYSHEAEVEVEVADGRKQQVRGVVHRDLKPQNILLTGSEGNWTAKISDYGLAKSFATSGLSGHTVTGGFSGTPDFMPREQVINFKYVKPVSDVWSLAATFYNMLTGFTPLDFPDGRDPLGIILSAAPVPILLRDPGIDARVAQVIDHALLDDKRRFQTASEFRRALAAVT